MRFHLAFFLTFDLTIYLVFLFGILFGILRAQENCSWQLGQEGWNPQQWTCIWHMGVSINQGTPKLMVYRENHNLNGWFGGTPISGTPHIFSQTIWQFIWHFILHLHLTYVTQLWHNCDTYFDIFSDSLSDVQLRFVLAFFSDMESAILLYVWQFKLHVQCIYIYICKYKIKVSIYT